MNLLETLMENVGQSKVPQYAKKSVGFRAIVTRSSDFIRIEGLPRRKWNIEPQISTIRKVLTDELKTDSGTLELWKIQAAALYDIIHHDGAFLPIGVGRGKAFISLLAPVVLEAERPILFVPAQLRDQTNKQVLPLMKANWKLNPKLRIVGYSELSLEKNSKMLEEYQPDLIVLDECHRVKNKKAGRTRRLVRWFNKHPETKCVAMSGTISKRSIKDFAHIIEWCLQDRAPIPKNWVELSEWADAIDEKVPPEKRVGPGALRRLCKNGENVRQGFQRRLTETPGVVASKENELGVALNLHRTDGPDIPDVVYSELLKMRTNWETPNGDLITEAVDLWRHMRELALGFWSMWDPPAPADWLIARREWKSLVRDVLKTNRRGLDTELQVWNDFRRKAPDDPVWAEWNEIKDTFKPNSVPVWLDPFAIKFCSKWLKKPGICWTEHVPFALKLAEYSGVPYFGAGDSRISECTEPSIIASRPAHGEGKNLQAYSRNLVVAPLSSGERWEQMLGRTHRAGQTADEVTCEIFLHIDELMSSFDQARSDARYLEDTYGNRQKLNYATIS